MSDMPSFSSPQPDAARHTLTVREVEMMFVSAGVHRSLRHIIRLCKSGMLDAVSIPGPTGNQWYVAPDSVPKAIGDLKQIDAQRARRTLTQQATSDHVMANEPSISDGDTASHSTPQPDMSAPENLPEREVTHSDKVGHSATDTDTVKEKDATDKGTSIGMFADLAVYEHPYVKRLEREVDQYKTDLRNQVQRTENIQRENLEAVLELQRLVTVGQSEILADAFVKATASLEAPRHVVIREPHEPTKTQEEAAPIQTDAQIG